MPHEPDDHPGPTKAPPPEPQGEPMVGHPATPPENPTHAVGGDRKCISFAEVARKRRRWRYTPAPPLRDEQAAGVVVMRTYEMRLRFGIEDYSDMP